MQLTASRFQGGRLIWGGNLTHIFQPVTVGHPLMICISKNGGRGGGAAAADPDCANPRLLLIHSAQSILDGVAPNVEVLNRRQVCFAVGGINACVERYRMEPPE